MHMEKGCEWPHWSLSPPRTNSWIGWLEELYKFSTPEEPQRSDGQPKPSRFCNCRHHKILWDLLMYSCASRAEQWHCILTAEILDSSFTHLHSQVTVDRNTWCFLGLDAWDRLMGVKESNSLCSLVSGGVYKQKWANPKTILAPNLLVYSSAANTHSAGYTVMFTNITSSYNILNNLKWLKVINLKTTKTLAVSGQNDNKFHVSIITCIFWVTHAVLPLFGHSLSHHNDYRIQDPGSSSRCPVPMLPVSNGPLYNWCFIEHLTGRLSFTPFLCFYKEGTNFPSSVSPEVDVLFSASHTAPTKV